MKVEPKRNYQKPVVRDLGLMAEVTKKSGGPPDTSPNWTTQN